MKGAVVSTRRGAVVSMVGRRRRSGSGGMRTQQRSCPQHISGSATIATRTSDPSIIVQALIRDANQRSRGGLVPVRCLLCAMTVRGTVAPETRPSARVRYTGLGRTVLYL